MYDLKEIMRCGPIYFKKTRFRTEQLKLCTTFGGIQVTLTPTYST